jgi:hypothetical protein
MTDKKEVAQAVMNEYYDKFYDNSAVAAALREVINQLQQSPGIISCADLLELCEELEKI